MERKLADILVKEQFFLLWIESVREGRPPRPLHANEYDHHKCLGYRMVDENQYAAPLTNLYMCAKDLLKHQDILVHYWTAAKAMEWYDIKAITYSGRVLAKELHGSLSSTSTPWRPKASKT